MKACAICTRPIRNPHVGRPRVICTSRRCENERRRQKRTAHAEKLAKLFSVKDFEEALELWACQCGICLKRRMLGRWGTTPLPVCIECADRPLSALAKDWLARVVPGCPLPNPWRRGP